MGILRNFVDKCLSVGRLGIEWLNKLICGITDAAKSESYVETKIPSQSDSFHKAVKGIDIITIKSEYEKIIRRTLKKLRLVGKKLE